jgi:hypothetical protein
MHGRETREAGKIVIASASLHLNSRIRTLHFRSRFPSLGSSNSFITLGKTHTEVLLKRNTRCRGIKL